MSFRPSNPGDVVRLATVQIWADGSFLGSGFFVERHIVVTCAHVVQGSPDDVTVACFHRTFDAKVLVRDPPDRGQGQFYAFPDLAFLVVTDPPDHPDARLATSPMVPDELTAVGYSAATPSPGIEADTLRLEVVGRSAEYLRVKGDEIVDGMSGAPVVDRMGLVHGVVKGSRDYENVRGGWIIPGIHVALRREAHAAQLGGSMRRRDQVLRPEVGTWLHQLFSAQRRASERMPYRLVDGPQPPLSSVYVELRTERRDVHHQAPLVAGRTREGDRPVLSIREMLRNHRHTLLVGGPGAGKSSLMQRIVGETASWFLAAQDHDHDRPDRPDAAEAPDDPPFGRVVPVRVSATALQSSLSWPELLANAVQADLGALLNGRVDPEVFEREPMVGVEWLLLIDGLDEVLDHERRQRLIEIIADHMAVFGGHWRFLVASRSLLQEEFAGLRIQGLEIGTRVRFEEYELRPFDPSSLALFATNWFAARLPDRSDEHVTVFLKRVADSRIAPLVQVPLLATIAAVLYESQPDTPLPANRVGLYERFVNGLLYERRARLDTRQTLRAHLGTYGRAGEELAELLFEETEHCLEEVAAAKLESDHHDAVYLGLRWLQGRFRPLPSIQGLSAHLRSLLVSTGLLVVMWDRVDFVHRGFAEYLAAGRIVRRGFDPETWLTQMRQHGSDNLNMFALARWALDGNDPTRLLMRLLMPGIWLRFPQLLTFCALLEDGLPVPDEATRRLTRLAVWGVKLGRLDEQVITSALLTISAHEQNVDVLAQVAGDRVSPPRKRIVAAQLLAEHGSAAERVAAMNVLTRLARTRTSPRHRRLAAMQALARLGDENERHRGLVPLARTVERKSGEAARNHGISVLLSQNEKALAQQALLRRAAHADNPWQRRHALDTLVVLDTWHYADELASALYDPRPAPKWAPTPTSSGAAAALVGELVHILAQPSAGPGKRAGVVWMLDELTAGRMETAVPRMMRSDIFSREERMGVVTLLRQQEHGPLAEIAFRLIASDDHAVAFDGGDGIGQPQTALAAAHQAVRRRYALLPVDAPADDPHILAAADEHLRRQFGDDGRTRQAEQALQKAWAASRCRWWASLRAETSSARGVDRAAAIALVTALTPYARAAYRRQLSARAAQVTRAAARAGRTAAGDVLNVTLALAAVYAATTAVGVATLRYGAEAPLGTVLDTTTDLQARLALPVLLIVAVIAVRPYRPQRALPRNAVVMFAAAGVMAIAAWPGGPLLVSAPPLPLSWQNAEQVISALSAYLGDQLVGETPEFALSVTCFGLAALMLLHTLSSRSVRTPHSRRFRLWALLKMVGAVLASAWLAWASGLDPDTIVNTISGFWGDLVAPLR